MQQLTNHYRAAAKKYAAGTCGPSDLFPLVQYAAAKLATSATLTELSACDGKNYSVFKAGDVLSRPYRPDLYEDNSTALQQKWEKLFASADTHAHIYKATPGEINEVLYTAMTAICCCFDVWKPGSRKTPGTIFEIILGTVIGKLLPEYHRSGHVILQGQTENVSTDIVFQRPPTSGQSGGIVIPAKITTRERIVQPFAHQRILNSFFGVGVYKSLLLCVSEMQRDRKANANAICVPGTVRLFTTHLAHLGGLFYLDPPARYLMDDVTSVITVRTIGDLLGGDLPSYL